MIEPPLPGDEATRLDGLHALGVLDTPPEKRFDRITRMAALAFDVPIALVSLVDEDRQWFKSKVGINACETPRDISFCGHAILRAEPLVVTDALTDPRFADNPLVTGDPGIRFYAGRPLTDAHGRTLGTLCVIDRVPRTLDVRALDLLDELGALAETELRSMGIEAATDALHDSEEMYRSVVGALAEGVLVVDAEGIIEQVNRSAAALLGLPLTRVRGRNLADLDSIHEFTFVGPDGSPIEPGSRPLVRTMQSGEAVDDELVGLRRADGQVIWLSVNTRRVYAASALRSPRTVLSFADVTHRVQVDRLKSEFVSMVSHELRTPLTSIRGALGLLAAGTHETDSTAAKQMLRIALTNTDRLVRLVNDILDIERMESGRVSLQPRDVELSDVLTQAVRVMEPLAGEAGIVLELESRGAQLSADPDRILQTVTNLLSNAIKFSPRGTAVEVWDEVGPATVTVHVRDRGRGVPASMSESIFDRFQQVDATDSREKGGSGLGLAIAKQIVEQHGGRIRVAANDGPGSTFTFCLPLDAGTRTDPDTGASEGSTEHTRPGRAELHLQSLD